MTISVNESISGGGSTDVSLDSIADAFGDLGAGNFLIEQVSTGVLAAREIGVGSATAVPTFANVSANFLGTFSSLPGNGVGANGDRALIWDTPDAMVAIVKSGGSWSRYAGNSGTFETMIALTPTEGTVWNATTIGLGGDAGTVVIDTQYIYTSSGWRPLTNVKLLSITADTASLTNSQTAYQAAYSITPPVGLFYAGCAVSVVTRIHTSVDGAATHSGIIQANSATLAPLQTAVDIGARAEAYLFCRTNNILSSGAGNTGFGVGTTSTDFTTMGAAFNGSSVTMTFGCTFSATTATTTIQYRVLDMTLLRKAT